MSEESGTATPGVGNATDSRGIGQLAAALALAQGEFATVTKSKEATIKSERTGTTFKYKYADLADVLKMALPILAKNGLAFTQRLRRIDHKLYLASELIHTSGETLGSDGLEISEVGADPRTFGTKLTYFRRYDASALLGIVSDEDVDAPDGLEPGAVTDKGVAGLRKSVVPQVQGTVNSGQGTEKKDAPEPPKAGEPPATAAPTKPAEPAKASGAPSTTEPQKPAEPSSTDMAKALAEALKEKFPRNPNAILKLMIAATYGKARFEDVPKEEQPKAVRTYYYLLKEQGKDALFEAARALTEPKKA